MARLSLNVSLTRPGFDLKVRQDFPDEGVTAITGPSGSGKTTLLRIIAGLEANAQGTVQLGDQLWQGQGNRTPIHKRRIGMMFQEPRLFPHLNVEQNLLYGAGRAGISVDACRPVFDALGLAPLLPRRVQGLSGGEQRRVALGRVLATKPSLLCLDEPLTGLDDATKHELMPFIARAIASIHCPALYVTHDMDEVRALAGQVIRIRDGRIVTQPAPVENCIELFVRRAGNGELCAQLGGRELRLPADHDDAGRRRIYVPATSILLSHDEVANAATLGSFSARIVSAPDDNATGKVHVELDGHVLAVRLGDAKASGLDLRPGRKIWASLLSAEAMPTRCGN
ncbi:ATP-binding cassette domain-containing protein [Qingshengfaniella alkalisoli]|uniref:ATP-binding cassette domain-containing protein n=1 Tax=Qingshengfaniella alkalisoli TaxID=2599296 RepID=A0A5B8IU56_9RHOB|nr:ATP-binding cassette domain-containing protein [Qingshengfaniella alkalisoli]QDY69013.1 ATP-binding cassette domain-containing protein [Qingshengfaniella alkalisoli]